jgi:hypothetical protein
MSAVGRPIPAVMIGGLATSMAFEALPEREDLRERLRRVVGQAG